MLINQLQWRYATKKFDQNKSLSIDLIDQILEAGRLAPSSFGLQPYRFFQISQEIRIEIQQVCFMQPQIVDAPALIAIQSKTKIDQADIHKYMQLIMSERGVAKENLAAFEGMIINFIKNLGSNALFWTQKQAGISLGFMLAMAAHLEVDSCPMEGFDQNKLDSILKTPSDLQTTVLLALGYRDLSDPYASLKKVRKKKEDIFF